jgi:ferric-chelate reductase
LCNIAESAYPISLNIYVTGERSACGSVTDDTDSRASPCGAEREVLLRENVFDYETISEMGDACGLTDQITGDEPKCNPLLEKLDVDGTISRVVGASGSHHRVLLLSCGPKSLMDAAQDSASKWQMKRNIRIDVHCEDFGCC